MTCYTVAKTIYINNDDDNFFRYEIIEDETGELVFAMAFIESRIDHEGVSIPVWAKLDNVEIDHLMPPKNRSFQMEVRRDAYPGKSIATVIDVCKKHRKAYKF